MKFFLLLIVFLFVLIPYGSAEAQSDSFVAVNIKDSLTIRVHDNPHLNINVKVTEDGYINFPFIGSIHVKGKTVYEIEDILEKKLIDYVNYPIVSVFLTRGFETQKIYLYGELRSYQAINFEDDLTLLEVLSLIGGITKDGRYGRLLIRRKKNEGYEDIELDIEKILDSHTGDILLRPHDIIIVEPNKKVSVEGAVTNRGDYALEKGMTVKRVLSLAGGITKSGYYGRVLIRRKKNESYEDIEIDIEQVLDFHAEDILLQPDDIVFVEPNQTFMIDGNVGNPGHYALKKGMTVKMALLENGVIYFYGKVILRRKQEGGQGYTDIDLHFKGDVRGELAGDILLQPSDMIIVEPNETYFVYGEIGSPGEFKLTKDSTVFSAMLLAGGVTKWGSEDRIKILRRTKNGKGNFIAINVKIGDFIKGDASADVALEPGDLIVFTPSIL
jgi:polysaccharide export outer membrane protein